MKNSKKNNKEIILIGARIRKRRKAKKMTMMDLAFETGIDYRQIGRIERGETNFTVITLIRIGKVLELKLKQMVS